MIDQNPLVFNPGQGSIVAFTDAEEDYLAGVDIGGQINSLVGDHVWQAILAAIQSGAEYVDGELTVSIAQIEGFDVEGN